MIQDDILNEAGRGLVPFEVSSFASESYLSWELPLSFLSHFEIH